MCVFVCIYTWISTRSSHWISRLHISQFCCYWRVKSTGESSEWWRIVLFYLPLMEIMLFLLNIGGESSECLYLCYVRTTVEHRTPNVERVLTRSSCLRWCLELMFHISELVPASTLMITTTTMAVLMMTTIATKAKTRNDIRAGAISGKAFITDSW